MWTPFLEHELYKYRPWSHPASCGLPRLLWPNNFGKIPRNSSKEFLKKKNEHTRKEEEEGHRTQVPCRGIWERNEKNSSGAAEETSLEGTHAAGLDGSPPRWEWKRESLKELTTRKWWNQEIYTYLSKRKGIWRIYWGVWKYLHDSEYLHENQTS